MITAAVAGVSAAKSVASGISSYLSSYDHVKDAERQAKNALAFTAAAAGSSNAFQFLKGMSGQHGAVTVLPQPGITEGGTASGWASPPARQDAERKYQSLRPKFEGNGLPNPDGTTPTTGNDPITGQPTATRPAEAGMTVPMMVLLVGLAIGAYLLSKRGT